MIIFVKRVQNFIYLNLEISLQSFPELMFIQFMFLWLFLWKGDKNCVVGQGGVYFLTPKSLLRLPHLWEFLNLLAKFSWTYVSAILCSYDYFCDKEQRLRGGQGGCFY